MAIEIDAPDGTVVEFPDGTDDATISRAMQQAYGGPQAPLGAPGSRAQPPRQAPVFRPMQDAGEAIGGAWNKFATDLGDDIRKGGAPKSVSQSVADILPGLGRSARNVANLAGVALSPITAITDAAIVRPAARAVAGTGFTDEGTARQAIGTSLMGAKAIPGRGLFGARAPVPAAPVPAELRAGQALTRAIQRDGMRPADVVARATANPNTPAFHAGGQNLRATAEVLANSPGPGNQTITRAVRNNQAGATDRVSEEIARGLGGRNDYFATVDSMKDARKTAADPFLKRAYATPIGSDVYQSRIAPIMSRLPKGSLEQAYDLARRDGRNPDDIGLSIVRTSRPNPGGGMVDSVSEVRVANPTLETLHYVKKGMDQTLEQYRNQVTGELDLAGSPGAQADSRVRSTLGKAMREINADYDKAMALWGDESDHLSALALGRNVFSPKFDMQAERLAGQVGEMSEASRDMFRKGVGEAVLAQARSTKGGVGAARQLLRSREFGDRVRLAFPEQRAFDDFMGAMDREVTLQDANNRVVGGSPTFPRQAARADLEAQSMDPLDAVATGLSNGLSPGRWAAQGLKSIPRKDRSLVGDPVLNELLSGGVSDPAQMERLWRAVEAASVRRATAPLRAARALPPLLEASDATRLEPPRRR